MNGRLPASCDEWTIEPADRVDPAALHAAFGQAFADYLIGPFQVDLDAWPAFLARQCVDLGLSRVALRDGRFVAFAFVAPRVDSRRWRLASMGAVPAARGTGVAAVLLEDTAKRARAAGMIAAELECFAQNERALRLYGRHGFEIVHALQGWRLVPGTGTPGRPIGRAVDCSTAFAWLCEVSRRVANLPMQVMPASLAASPRPLTCWQFGSAQLIFSVVEDTPIQIHSLVDTNVGQRHAQELLEALRTAYPGRECSVSPLQRADVGGDALRREGYRPLELHQVLMVRCL